GQDSALICGEARVSEYRDEFVQALREGKRMRHCMFNVLEQQHAADFANGPKGVKLYNDLFDAVSAAEVPGALEEYEQRFFPMLDPDGSRARAAALASAAAAAGAAQSWVRRDGPWLMGAFAAVAVAVTVLALNATASPPKATPAVAAAPAVAA